MIWCDAPTLADHRAHLPLLRHAPLAPAPPRRGPRPALVPGPLHSALSPRAHSECMIQCLGCCCVLDCGSRGFGLGIKTHGPALIYPTGFCPGSAHASGLPQRVVDREQRARADLACAVQAVLIMSGNLSFLYAPPPRPRFADFLSCVVSLFRIWCSALIRQAAKACAPCLLAFSR